jgi:hypothetical protein
MMCIQPKYKVVRLIDRLKTERTQFAQQLVRTRSKTKKAAYGAKVEAFDWCISQIRAEIR